MFDRARIIAERDAARRDVAQLRARLAAAEKRDRVVRDLVTERLLVFLREGGMFDGLLVDTDERTLTFGDVHRRGADGATSTAAAPGLLYVERAKVAYLQRVYEHMTRGE